MGRKYGWVIKSCVLAVTLIPELAKGIDAVYIANPPINNSFSGGGLQVQGFAGRAALSVAVQSGAGDPFPFSSVAQVAGAAANDTTLFTLVNGTSNGIIVQSL